MSLNLAPNFHKPGERFFYAYSAGDEFYQWLMDTHRELSEAQSDLLNAKLVLLLSNHIGDINVLKDALAAARADI